MLPKELFVTVILWERHTVLEPFPTLPLLNKSYRLAGRVDPGFRKLQVVVTLPNGKVTESALGASPDGRFDAVVPFDRGAGEYSVEITAEGRLGPAVLDLMHCYAGVAYPPPVMPPAAVAAPADLRQAERMMLDMVNRARLDAGLPPLLFDERVAEVARKHGQDMATNRFFAHVSPTQGDLSDRMKRGGIAVKKCTENLATNQTLSGAHQGLMESPGHRKNILDPDVSRLGIGIVRSDGGQLLVTEDFTQPYQALDAGVVGAQFLADLNASRARDGNRPLTSSPILDRIAAENSRAMMVKETLGYDRARSLLEQEKLRYRYIQMAVFKSADPLKPEQLAEALKPRYTHVGIGVTQSSARTGEKFLWFTVLLAEK
jgi:uncharacterized protein YkwD